LLYLYLSEELKYFSRGKEVAMKRNMIGIGFLVGAVSVWTVQAGLYPMEELKKKAQDMALRRAALGQNVESSTLNRASVAANLSGRNEEAQNLRLPAFVQDPEYKALQILSDKEKALVGGNYETVFFAVPREILLKYIVLQQADKYLKEQNRSRRDIDPGSLLTYISKTVSKPLRVELGLDKVFARSAQKPVLMRQLAFDRPQRINAQGWLGLSPYVQGKLLDALVSFLNQYVDMSGYDENILVQLAVPKNRISELIVAKVGGRDYAFEQGLDAFKGGKDVYAILKLQPGADYNDLKTFIVHSAKGSFGSGVDVSAQLAQALGKFNAVLLNRIENAPNPVARGPVMPTSVVSTSVVPAAPVLPKGVQRTAPENLLEQIRQGTELKRVAPPMPVARVPEAPTSVVPTSVVPAAPGLSQQNRIKSPLPTAPVNLLGQIRQGVELKKSETVQKPQGQVRGQGLQESLSERIMRAQSTQINRQLEENSSDDEWKENRPPVVENLRSQVVQPPKPVARPGTKAPVANPSFPAAEESPQYTLEQLQASKELQDLLSEKLKQRRGAIDEESGEIDEDWD
jgi:hypothetical protein